ncbi:MAG: EamA family transporter, partial [Burkholderiales bacterium]|nr:EamA family transporter [Burkholderiales bacterium]
AFGIVFISRFKPQQENILNLSLWMLLISTMVISPVTFYTNEFYALGINYNTFLIILEIVLSTVGYVLMFLVIQRAGPVLFVLVNGVSAIAGLFYGRLLFDQQISLVAYFAIGLIVLAIIGLSLTKRYKIYE